MIVIGGFKMGTAQGDSQKFESGKSTLIQAGIGTLVVMFAAMGGNYFVAQIGSASGAAQVQQVAMQDVAALEAPQVTSVTPEDNRGLTITFTEPVQVINADSVRIGTNNMGTLQLAKDASKACTDSSNTAATNADFGTASGKETSTLRFCITPGKDAANTPSLVAGATAIQFVMGRGGQIQDSDGNNAIVAFAQVPLK